MNAQTQPEDVAAVCDRRRDHAPGMEAYLQAHGAPGARWYPPPDLDEVDRAVRSGGVRRVVFPRLDDLLEGVWNGEVALGQWLASGTRIEFVEAPEPAVHTLVAAVLESWQQHQRRRRRRQAIAGVILSAAALAAAFVLNWVTA